MGLFDKLKQGLQRTSQQVKERLDRLDEMVGLGSAPEARTREIDVDTADALEEILLMADVGVAASGEIVEAVRKRQRRGESLRDLVKQEMLRILESTPAPPVATTVPQVILIVGVNGVGKTTTIGKLANQLREEGKKPLICAADTFRAAAVDQLATWAERAGAEVVRPEREGQDPASVAFQTIEYAKRTGTEIVIIDTAGRLHTKGGLMDELGKIKRVVEKQAPISEVLLVLDATTGQNGLAQAEAFLQHGGVTGLVLTKLDGSAKGGFVIAVQEKTGLPIKLIGQGEGIGDLTGFTPHVFAQKLVG